MSSNLIEVSEAETVALIEIADRENPLPLRFGGNHVWLDLDAATNKFTDHLKKMRRSDRGDDVGTLPKSEGGR